MAGGGGQRTARPRRGSRLKAPARTGYPATSDLKRNNWAPGQGAREGAGERGLVTMGCPPRERSVSGRQTGEVRHGERPGGAKAAVARRPGGPSGQSRGRGRDEPFMPHSRMAGAKEANAAKPSQCGGMAAASAL